MPFFYLHIFGFWMFKIWNTITGGTVTPSNYFRPFLRIVFIINLPILSSTLPFSMELGGGAVAAFNVLPKENKECKHYAPFKSLSFGESSKRSNYFPRGRHISVEKNQRMTKCKLNRGTRCDTWMLVTKNGRISNSPNSVRVSSIKFIVVNLKGIFTQHRLSKYEQELNDRIRQML